MSVALESPEASVDARHLHAIQNEEDRPHIFTGDFYIPSANQQGYEPIPFPVHDVGIESNAVIGDPIEYGRIGTGQRVQWQMSDGSRFKTMLSEPFRRRTNVAIEEDTAWCCQIEGFFEDSALESMKMGAFQLTKGPEEDGAEVPMALSAYYTELVLAELERIGLIAPDVVIRKGFSRGAMMLPAKVVHGQKMGRTTLYAHQLDPCAATEVDFDLTPENILKLLKKAPGIPGELGAFAIEAFKLSLDPRRAWRYRKTADFSRAGIRQIKATGKAVLSGEAGYLAHYYPDDVETDIGFFLSSSYNDQHLFRQIYDPLTKGELSNVEFHNPNGAHGTGINPRVFGNTSMRIMGLVQQLEDNVPYDKLDYRRVHKPRELEAA